MSYTVEKSEDLLGIEDLMQMGKGERNKGGKKGPKPLGRPRSDSSLNRLVRIDEALAEIIKSENRPRERFNDTIKRMLKEKSQKIQEQSEEIERLKSQFEKS